MAEFYGYAEREADSYINWGEISKNMSDMIVKTNQAREDKKKAIDDATNELSNYINNEQPFGEHKDASTAALNLGSQASNFLLAQHKLLKSGQLRPEDFVMNREKLKSSITASYNALKNYQSTYSQLMNDYKNGKISYGQLLNAAQVEKFGNFTTSGFFVTPTTGEVVIAEKEERIVNGKKVYVMSSNPSKVTTPNAINALIVGNWNKYDQESNAKQWVESIGEKQLVALREIGTRTKAGSITTLLDPTNKAISTYTDDQKNIIAEFKVAEDNRINAMLSNNYDRASLMLDYIRTKDGKQFETVYDNPDAAKKDPTKINMVKDKNTGGYVPEFTEEQIKISNDWMRQDLRARYDRKEEMRPVSDYNAPSYRPFDVNAQEYKTQIDRQKEIGKNAALLQTAPTPEVAFRALQNINSLSGGTSRPTADGYIFTNSQGLTQEFKLNVNKEGFVTSIGAFLLGADKWDPKALKAGFKEAKVEKLSPSSVRASQLAKTQNPEWNNFIQSQGYIGERDPDATVSQINSNFAQFGIRAESKGDKVLLYGPMDKEGTPLDIRDRTKANPVLQQFIRNNASDARVEQSFAPIYQSQTPYGGTQTQSIPAPRQ